MKPFLKYALFTTAVIIIWTLVQYITGLDRSDTGKYLSWVSYPVMIFFIVLTLKEVKNQNNGFLGFGEGFKNGFMLILVAGVLLAVFTWVYFSFINPDFIDFAKEKVMEEMENKDLSDEQIEQGMSFMNMLMSPGFMTAIGLMGNIIIGTVFSLIVAAIMKKEKPVAAA